LGFDPKQIDVVDLIIHALRSHEKILDGEVAELKDVIDLLKQIVDVLHKGEKLGWGTARGLATALAYAMNSELKEVDKNVKKLFVSEFFHALNRRNIVEDETYDLIDEVCGLLE